MAIIVNGVLMNSEEDNRKVEEFLKRQKNQLRVRCQSTGEVFTMPLIEMSTRLDFPEKGGAKK